MAVKTCTKCHIEKDLSQFNKSKLGIFGLRGECKDCQSKYRQEHYSKNADASKAYTRQTYWNNPEKARSYRRESYAANPERERRAAVIDRQQNPERVIAYNKAYYKNNAAAMREKSKTWRKNNPEKKSLYDRLRNYIRKGADGKYSAQEWENLKADYGYKCAYCGKQKKLTADHVIAIKNGGSNFIENIVPACRSCNSSKKDKLWVEWFYAR